MLNYNALSTALTAGRSAYSNLNKDDDELTNDPFETVNRLRTRYHEAGEEAPKPRNVGTLLQGALTLLNTPGNAVRGLLAQGGEGFVRGITNKKTYDTQDFLKSQGMDKGLGRTLLGIGGDILTDPLTYINPAKGIASIAGGLSKGAGTKIAKKLGQTALKEAGEAAVNKTVSSGLRKTLSNTMNTLGLNTSDEVVEHISKVFKIVDTDDVATIFKKVTGESFAGGTAKDITAKMVTTAKKSIKAEMDAIRKLRGLVSKTVTPGGKGALKTDVARAITDMLTTDPTSFKSLDTLETVLKGRDIYTKSGKLVKSKKVWDDVFNHFATTSGQVLDDTAKASIQKLAMSKEQLSAAMQISKEFGTKIKGIDKILLAGKTMPNLADDTIKEIIKAGGMVDDATKLAMDAQFKVVLGNGLNVAVDQYNNTRIFGVSLPFTNKVLPLADVTKMTLPLEKLYASSLYKVPAIKAIDDWWQKAIAGMPTREARAGGIAPDVKGVGEITNKFIGRGGNQHKYSEEFIKNAFGEDIITNSTERAKNAVASYINSTTGSTDEIRAANKYVWKHLNPGAFPSETLDDIAKALPDKWRTNLQTVVKDLAPLNSDELTQVENLVTLVRGQNSMMHQLELKSQLAGNLAEEAYRENYVYQVLIDSAVNKPLKSTTLGKAATGKASTYAGEGLSSKGGKGSVFKNRQYESVAHAMAVNPEFTPVTDIVQLQTLRFNNTLKMGVADNFIYGIDAAMLHSDEYFESLAKNIPEEIYPTNTKLVDETILGTPKDIPRSATEVASMETAAQKRLSNIDAKISSLKKSASSAKHPRELEYLEAYKAKALKKAEFDKLMSNPKSVGAATYNKFLKEGKDKLSKKQLEIMTQIENVYLNPIKEADGVMKEIMDNASFKKAMMGRPKTSKYKHGGVDKVRVTPENLPGTYGKDDAAYKKLLSEATAERETLDKIAKHKAGTETFTKKYVPHKTVTKEVPIDQGIEIDKIDEARKSARATFDAFVNAVGGDKGLLEFKNVVKPAGRLTAPEKASGTWVMLSDLPMGKDMNTANKYYVHKELVPHLDKISNLIHGESLSSLIEMYDNGIRILKLAQTTLNPSFAPRNFMGEAVGSVLRGTKLKSFTIGQEVFNKLNQSIKVGSRNMYLTEAITALKTMNPTRKVLVEGTTDTVANTLKRLVADASVTIGNKSYFIEDLYSAFVNTRLGTAGMTTSQLHESIPDIAKHLSYSSKPFVASTKELGTDITKKGLKGKAVAVPKFMKNIAENATQWTEQSFRMADFVQGLSEGLDYDTAARLVKMYHVDYSDLTAFERKVMRRVVPYYTFMRRNIPQQLRLMVETPGYYSALGHLVRNSNAALENPDAVPDYLKRGLALPLYQDSEGNVTYLNWNLPVVDLARFTTSWKENWQEALGSVSPAIRIPTEMATGRNIMFDSEIKDPLAYAMSHTGVGNTIYNALKGALTGEEGKNKYARPGQIPFYGSILPKVNPKQQELQQAYSYRDQLLEAMAKKRKQGIEYEVPDYEKSRYYQSIKGQKKYTP